MNKPLVIAHRGFCGKFPENSRRAFLEAIAVEGCDGFETDVHLSADNEPVIIHDGTLERTTNGTGPVNAMTFKDLRRLDVGSWMGLQFAGEQMMHLSELLDLCIQHDKVLNIELKSGQTPYPNLEQIVIDLVCAKNAVNRVFLSSFNHISMEICKGINPDIRTGLLYMQPLIKAEKYASGHALHPMYNLMRYEPDLVERAHQAGLAVHTWTVNSEEDMQFCIRQGVD
ncbi:MAG: glycerophosphodiester phosphodiesterase, partial [Defluviitaleaceae bacterium]|nr:glycerophosphodiester phosphodiesterase [Defluviitaleaceae bacterium]